MHKPLITCTINAKKFTLYKSFMRYRTSPYSISTCGKFSSRASGVAINRQISCVHGVDVSVSNIAILIARQTISEACVSKVHASCRPKAKCLSSEAASSERRAVYKRVHRSSKRRGSAAMNSDFDIKRAGTHAT